MVAFVLSVVGTYVFYARLRGARALVKQVVVTTIALAPGSTLNAENVKLMDWPANVPIEGSLKTLEEANGRVLLYAMDASEPIRQRLLAVAGTGPMLTGRIPEGMRMIALRTNDVNNVGGFLFPGARVDVLVTIQISGVATTRTVLQDAQVFTVGQKTNPDPADKPEDAKVVTILASPEDSQKLVLASTHGTLQLILRSATDKKTVNPEPVSLSELIGNAKPKPIAAPLGLGLRRAMAPKAIIDSYSIEMVTGDKKSVSKFYLPKESGPK